MLTGTPYITDHSGEHMGINKELVIAVILTSCLVVTSCNDATDSISLPESLTISQRSEETSEVDVTTSESETAITEEKIKDVDWYIDPDTGNYCAAAGNITYDIKILNSVEKASVYSLKLDLDNNIPDGCKQIPDGFVEFTNIYMSFYHGNGWSLVEGVPEEYVDRGIFNQVTDSFDYMNPDDLPQALQKYIEDNSLCSNVITEETPDTEMGTKLFENGLGTLSKVEVKYPVSNYYLRQQLDGIPILSYWGYAIDSRLSYGDLIPEGNAWTADFTGLVGFTDGRCIVDVFPVFITDNVKNIKTLCKNDPVIPFDEILSMIPAAVEDSVKYHSHFIGSGQPGIKDIRVIAAELCYVVIGDDLDFDNCKNYYLAPYWTIYYSCGEKDGAMCRNAAFIPATKTAYESKK